MFSLYTMNGNIYMISYIAIIRVLYRFSCTLYIVHCTYKYTTYTSEMDIRRDFRKLNATVLYEYDIEKFVDLASGAYISPRILSYKDLFRFPFKSRLFVG